MKAFFKAVTLLSLTLPYQLKTAQIPWYQDYFHKLDGARYTQHCSLIDIAQKIRGAALLTYYRTTHKKAHLDKAICLVQQQLKQFEPWLITLEKETLNSIKEKYHMSDDIWHKCLADMQQIKDSYWNGMLHSMPKITHDPNVPADIQEILTTLLRQNGINPQAVQFTMVSDQKEIGANKNTMVQVQSFIKSAITSTSNNNLSIFSTYLPASIEIFPQLKERSLTEKISFCAHEVQHLIQHHSLTELVLTEYLNHYYGVTTEEFQQIPAYHTLSQIHEAQAEILAAIKNPTTAECLAMMRKKYPYPDHLYEEHFIHLSTINMLWKVHAWLEFFHHNGVIKKEMNGLHK